MEKLQKLTYYVLKVKMETHLTQSLHSTQMKMEMEDILQELMNF